MGFCDDAQYKGFLQQAPVFEKLLVDDGILLFKYWLAVDQAQQEERFAERLEDPLKKWKLYFLSSNLEKKRKAAENQKKEFIEISTKT